ncbi:hypothetical protein R1flu_000067 [Riccia fluitans]|uniref:Uncharacterized protein n=1 Tax=Riccia fluitans TaxID=41844 RepID=A0ABD1Y2I8_9MARC
MDDSMVSDPVMQMGRFILEETDKVNEISDICRRGIHHGEASEKKKIPFDFERKYKQVSTFSCVWYSIEYHKQLNAQGRRMSGQDRRRRRHRRGEDAELTRSSRHFSFRDCRD